MTPASKLRRWMRTIDDGKLGAYRSWVCMRARCRNPNRKDYKNYGGRGIKICARWDSFEDFYADVGPRPTGKTLDRVENDLGYQPGNCRWATRREQSRNCRHGSTTVNKIGVRGAKPEDGKFAVGIRSLSKHLRIGVFATREEAAHAYNKAAIALHGKFAVLNPVGTDPRAAP